MDERLRQEVIDRAQGICEYYRLPQHHDVRPFQVDHIIARQHHGPTSSLNLAWSCWDCSKSKGPNLTGRNPDSGEIILLFHPRRDAWEDHVEWHGALLVAKTNVGLVTIDVLAINRTDRVDIRRELMAARLYSADTPQV